MLGRVDIVSCACRSVGNAFLCFSFFFFSRSIFAHLCCSFFRFDSRSIDFIHFVFVSLLIRFDVQQNSRINCSLFLPLSSSSSHPSHALSALPHSIFSIFIIFSQIRSIGNSICWQTHLQNNRTEK